MNTQTTAQRPLTSARVSTLLGKAKIAKIGTAKLDIVRRAGGNTGNGFTRENGTAVHIFNVLAFATVADAQYASEEWKKGTAKEKAGDVDGAQVHFKEALNSLMSFSVLAANAPDYQAAHQITARIEMVPAGKASQDAGIKEVLGINSPSPVAIGELTETAASLFELPVEAETPVAPPAGGGMAGAGRRARKAATAAK